MSCITRRLFSNSLYRHSSAAEACSELLSRFQAGPVSIRKQVLDANQLQLLSITLNRTPSSLNPPPDGTPIPPGYHLVYFTPSIIESELGLDGSDRTVNPLRPFSRRMWAGGELKWTQDVNALLRVGQEVREITRLLSAEPKTLKTGGHMLVVGLEKTFSNNSGTALVDRRNWVFRTEINPQDGIKAPPKPVGKLLPKGRHMRDFCQSAVTLFRFSALTFNAHKIHYQPEWCREVEGHRNPVVHGPLNLINMLDLWRDTVRGGHTEAAPKSIKYKATSPLYIDEPYRILLERIDEEKIGKEEWTTEIWDGFGQQSMKGVIVG